LIIIYICPHAFPDHEAAMAVHGEACKIRKEFDQYLKDHEYIREPD
jgi:hypothetical protein